MELNLKKRDLSILNIFLDRFTGEPRVWIILVYVHNRQHKRDAI